MGRVELFRVERLKRVNIRRVEKKLKLPFRVLGCWRVGGYDGISAMSGWGIQPQGYGVKV